MSNRLSREEETPDRLLLSVLHLCYLSDFPPYRGWQNGMGYNFDGMGGDFVCETDAGKNNQNRATALCAISGSH